ncbi:MAG: EF-hand domain-containing protein [Candidatus Brocadiae bacterium]|nr:EF-hand domain-containing protein [Candidatus Brocadiia bacterium]
MLGARRDVGATDEQLRAYASHFDRSDPNHDGKHTRAEYVDGGRYMTPQARAGIFGATDNNADDVVTRAEYVLNRTITDEAKAIVQRTDSDKNGKVTRAEFVKGSPIEDKALAGAVYDALDTSGDGVITVPEYLRVWGGWARPNYKAQEAAIADRLAKLGKESDNGGRPAGGPPSVEQMFKIMDRDKDGTLTKAEFRGPPHVFTAADKDKDGVVTRAEMEAFRARTGKGGTAPGPPGRARAEFATPHALNPAIVKKDHNLVVDKDGREVAPQGRPIQEGYRLVRLARPIEGHDRRAYAKAFSIMAPIRDALIHRLDKTPPAEWKTLTAILEKNRIKTRQWLKGPTPRDNTYSSQGIFEHLRSTYAGKIPAKAVPGNTYADRDYHAMMKYLDETELELKFRTFSADFDFTNPEGVDPRPHPAESLIE